MKKEYLVLLLLVLLNLSAGAANSDSIGEHSTLISIRNRPARYLSHSMNGIRPLKLQGEGDDVGVPVSFSGAFRFFGLYRSLDNAQYATSPKNLSVSGFGDSRQPLGGSPLLTLLTKIIPTEGVDLTIGFGFNHNFSGSIDPDSSRSRNTFGQSYGVVANFKTRIGTIKVGGGNLYTGLSQLFSGWSNIRWNPFYRLPWDVSAQYGGSWSSYEEKYTNGSVTKVDPAYANGGRNQGVILQFADFPAGFGLNLSYGVTGQTGLRQVSDSIGLISITKKSLGARLYKKIKAHTIGLTGITNEGYIDNYSSFRESQYMYSADVLLVHPLATITAEVGATRFTNPFGQYNGTTAGMGIPLDTVTYISGVDMLVQVRLDLKKQLLGIPFQLHFYNLGPNYINSNSGVFNTSTYNYTPAYQQINSTWDVAMRKGFIADVGQYANNRRAVELMTQVEKGKFKATIGTQAGTEIEKDTLNQVMFYHHLNPWSRAGFNYWTPQGGPYQKLLGNYIQLLERVTITDSVVDYKKGFNVLNLDTRFKTNIFRRSMIFANYLSYQSARVNFSPIPTFSEKAFIRVFYEELTMYYHLFEKTTLVGHGAISRAVANNRTTLSTDNGKPVDQFTYALGGGIDWNFAPNMGLYVREMYMNHKDKNFKLDHFRSFETSLELKVMF